MRSGISSFLPNPTVKNNRRRNDNIYKVLEHAKNSSMSIKRRKPQSARWYLLDCRQWSSHNHLGFLLKMSSLFWSTGYHLRPYQDWVWVICEWISLGEGVWWAIHDGLLQVPELLCHHWWSARYPELGPCVYEQVVPGLFGSVRRRFDGNRHL